MEEDFSRDETKGVIWDCDGDKIPGPDEFNITFLKKSWDILGEEIIGLIQEFHSTTVLPKAITASFLTLIPKSQNHQRIDDFRPIFLIGCLYKIVPKILSNRLKKVVGSIVSKSQTGFIPGREILDGVLVTNEVIDFSKRRKRECLLFKVDFAQAYDNVCWEFLRYMLNRLNLARNG